MPLRKVIPYLPHGRRPLWKGQAIAFLAIIFALACRALADPFVDNGLYFTFLFPAVLIAGLFGGTWSGVSTAVFGALLIAYIWIPPRLSFRLSGDGDFRLIAFWSVASMVIFLTAFVHTVLDRLAAAEARATTVAREMQHRVQNTLALVQAVARQTFRTAEDLGAAQRVFAARLDALGRAQTLIADEIDADVGIDALIKAALSPFDIGQFTLNGPSIVLPKDASVSFALLVHELATNAAKYGALSSAAGRIEILWTEEPDQRACLTWKERLGPAVIPSARVGFGSKLLRTAFPQGAGDASIAFEPDGVRCTITFPIVSSSTAVGMETVTVEPAAVPSA
jgi:two-component sensor histidine kinase